MMGFDIRFNRQVLADAAPLSLQWSAVTRANRHHLGSLAAPEVAPAVEEDLIAVAGTGTSSSSAMLAAAENWRDRLRTLMLGGTSCWGVSGLPRADA
ncbi:MAG: hypothetical protein FRX49_00402 [Trebouxia sp. A1-2]|nr:MAG: hypothetical protein FRX49_00402 [Trebouxia sp. A1-2]